MKKYKLAFSYILILILSQIYVTKYVNAINSTTMALSYEYGFISRGLIGTIYQLIDKFLPISIMNPDGIAMYAHIMNILYFILLFWFFIYILDKSELSVASIVTHLSITMSLYAIPIFLYEQNLGRLDLYGLSLSIIMAMIIISQKHEWLIMPLSTISMLIHHGHIFMFLNIPLALLMYRLCDAKNKTERKKYMNVLLFTIISVSILFLYFEFFSHTNEMSAYESIANKAKQLCVGGIYDETLLNKIVFGIGNYENEAKFRLIGRTQFAIFAILISSHIITTCKIYKKVIGNSKGIEKCKYVCMTIGTLTLLPEILLKCDYGRYAFAMIAYYLLTFISMLAMGDKNMEKEFLKLEEKLSCKNKFSLYLFYWFPVIFPPFMDVDVNLLTYFVAEILNKTILFWW
jgi:hypothetical protein